MGRYYQLFLSFFKNIDARAILIRKNILYSFIIKLITIVFNLTIVSLSIKYLGKSNYGVWVVLSGIMMWASLFDFGFTNGLRNRLAESIARKNYSIGKYYVATTYVFLFFLAIIMFILSIPLIYYIDWQNFLNISDMKNSDIKYILSILMIFTLIQFILKPINAIVSAYQYVFIVPLISLIGLALSLISIILLSYSENISIMTYIFYMAGLPIVGIFFSSVYFFAKKFRALTPSFKNVKLKYFYRLSSLGLSFFIIQVCGLIILQTDNIIISNLLGPKYVTEYTIAFKYFNVLLMFFLIILSPYWSAFTDAYHKHELEWIKSSIYKLLLIQVVLIILLIIFVIFANDVIRIWIDETTNIPISLSMLLATYVFLTSLFNIFAFFMNGIGKIKIQLYLNMFSACINIPLSYFLAQFFNLGINGVLLATIVSISLPGIFMVIQYLKIINGKASGIWNK